MKQLVVISDSHGRNEVFDQLEHMYPQAEAYLCCGDSEVDQASLGKFISVQGNNDLWFDHPIERRLTIDGVEILIIHSHQFPISQAISRLIERCKKDRIQLCLYGHAHTFRHTQEAGITLVNPGSIHYNRDGSEPSYALISLDQGNIQVECHRLPREKHQRKWF